MSSSLKALFLLLEKVKQHNNEAMASQRSEEAKAQNEKPNVRVYSRKLVKDLLERAVFMSIKLGDFKQALAYQKQVCDLNELMYEPKTHPLQPLQLYGLGKLQSQIAQTLEKPI